MSANYEHDQERLLNTAAQAVQTAVSAGAHLWASRQKPLKVEIRTASQDVRDAQRAIKEGIQKQEILKSIREGEVYQRVAKAGGDAEKYERLIWQRAEIDHAMEIMPSSQAPSHAKTPRKSL